MKVTLLTGTIDETPTCFALRFENGLLLKTNEHLTFCGKARRMELETQIQEVASALHHAGFEVIDAGFEVIDARKE